MIQSLEVNQLQQQQTQQHNIKQLISWINTQISKKNLPQLNSIHQLSSGNIFLQIVSIYYPKKVDLTKTFMNPKDDYEILQNFKQLSSAFNKLGWKKIDPQKFRKRKDKQLLLLAQFLKKILSQHLFDNNESINVHSLLTSQKSPEKIESQKKTNELIKIQDRKNLKINDVHQNQKHYEIQGPIRKKSENFKNNQHLEKLSSGKQVLPPKLTNPNAQQKRLTKVQPKNLQKQFKSPKLPPHPQLASKNIIASVTSLKHQEQQLNNFQNMRITKLQKQKQLLLKKILQIQQLVSKQKNQLIRKNMEMKILDQIDPKEQLKNQNTQKQNIQRVQLNIMNLLADITL